MSSTSESQHERKVRAFAAYSQGGEIKDFEYTPLPLGPNDVEISIQACGVCHTDLHGVHNDWKMSTYPLVPGHEIIGQIIAVGDDVKTLKVGQRVGVGPQVGSCRSCKQCRRGEPQLCTGPCGMIQVYGSPTGNPTQPHTHGGFARSIRTPAAWTFAIPDALPTNSAAPLLCAGITTWGPFVHNKVTKDKRVGIIGMGGLGHLAVQFAVALGCHTTVISTSSDKMAEAKKFGAQGFLNMSDSKQVGDAAGTLDFVLSTVGAEINADAYFSLLAPDATFVFVGVAPVMKFSPFPIIMKRANIQGSIVGSPSDIVNMLEFCAKHKITAQIEELDMSARNANQALKKVKDNSARYRMVLVNREFLPIQV